MKRNETTAFTLQTDWLCQTRFFSGEHRLCIIERIDTDTLFHISALLNESFHVSFSSRAHAISRTQPNKRRKEKRIGKNKTTNSFYRI